MGTGAVRFAQRWKVDMSRVGAGNLLVAMLVTASAAALGHAADPSRTASSYVLLADTELRARSLTVVSGNVGVNSGRLSVSIALTAPASQVAADMVDIRGGQCASLHANVAFGGGAAICGPPQPYVGPIVADAPASCGFPSGTFPACDPNLGRIIEDEGTVTLSPGTYGDLVVKGKTQRNAGVVLLRAGAYRFCNLYLSKGAQLRALGPVQLNVAGEVRIGRQALLGPAGEAGSQTVSARDIRLLVNGAPIRLSGRAAMEASLCAPHATLRANSRVRLRGSFVAHEMVLGRLIEVGLAGPPVTTTTTSTTSSTSRTTSSIRTTTTTSTSRTTSSTRTSTSTTTTTSAPRCGNGMLNTGEDCDPPGSLSCPGSPGGALLQCRADCTCPPRPTTTTSSIATTTSTSRTTTTSTSSSLPPPTSTTSTSTSTSSTTTTPPGACPTEFVLLPTPGLPPTQNCGGFCINNANGQRVRTCLTQADCPATPASTCMGAPTAGISSGELRNGVAANAPNVGNLAIGCLYVGGGANSQTPPNKNVVGSPSIMSVLSTTCTQPVLNVGGSAGTNIRNCTRGPSQPGLEDGCFFGPPLPIEAGAFSTCVVNRFSANATGMVNQDTGQAELSFPLTSIVHLTSNVTDPCPRCVNNVCNSGQNRGLACAPVGTAATSFDCPPAVNSRVGPLGVTLSPLRTEEVSRTAANGVFCTGLPGPVANQPVPGAFGVSTARRIAQRGQPAGNLRDRLPHDGRVAAVFCIPATGNGLVDNQANLPGPGAVSIKGDVQLR